MCGLDMTRRNTRRAHQRGLSIIELMVGIVISLMVALVSVGSANVFSAMQRQGISTGGAAVNSASALAALKNDAALAGLGFFGDAQFLCNRLNLSVGATKLSDGAEFTPVRITRDSGRDSIDVVFGTQVAAGSNVLLNSTSSGATAELRSLLPVSATQAVLLAPPTPGDPCLVRSVTAVTPSTDTDKQLLTFGSTGTHNAATFTTAASYADKSRVTLLGELQWSRYRVEGTDLVLERPLADASAVLARNVMAFRAEYGLAAAAAGSTTLTSWRAATGSTFGAITGATLPRVRAIRVGMVTRSPQREKANASGVCEASTAKPELFGDVITPDVSDWQCYRYRTTVVIVPLRNLVMGFTTP
jgi:type IV pilus assembly protein PilW